PPARAAADLRRRQPAPLAPAGLPRLLAPRGRAVPVPQHVLLRARRGLADRRDTAAGLHDPAAVRRLRRPALRAALLPAAARLQGIDTVMLAVLVLSAAAAAPAPARVLAVRTGTVPEGTALTVLTAGDPGDVSLRREGDELLLQLGASAP